MSKKRGLSVEEKRTRMMEFFFEKKDFFQLKELEKLCQKEKGITSMSVKDILTSLVDDGMVDTEKIGTSVYFWAFPSKASQNLLLHSCVCGKRKRKINDLTKSITDIVSKRKHVEELISKAQVGREDSDNRAAILSELSTKQSECQELESELKRYHDCDPEVVEEMKEEASVCKESANRWTDNIFSIKSWVKNKFHFEDSVVDKQFGIPDDLDYID